MDAAGFAIVSSPRRQEILRLVWRSERSAGDIRAAMPDVTFGAVSQHLRTLERAGFVEVRRASRFRYYRARRRALGPVASVLERMWDDALWQLKLQAELAEGRRGPRPNAAAARRQSARKGNA